VPEGRSIWHRIHYCVYNEGNSHRAVALVHFAGLSLGALAALLWATSGPFFRIAGSYDLDVVVINLVRFSLSSLVLLGVLFARQRHRKEQKWNVMHPLSLLGSAGMVVSSLFLTLAFLRIPIGTSMVLYHTAPFWVMLGTWCFSRKAPTAFQVVAFVLAMVGVWKTVGGVRLAASLDLPGVASALGRVPGLSHHYYLEVSGTEGHRELHVTAESLEDLSCEVLERLQEKAAKEIHSLLGIRSELHVLPPGSIDRSDGKSRRIRSRG